MTLNEEILQELHDCLLMDIAFEIHQAGEFKKLRQKHLFGPLFKNFDESVKLLRDNKERLMDEYKKKYGKPPDLTLAKRLFLNNQRAHEIAGGGPGTSDFHNPIA